MSSGVPTFAQLVGWGKLRGRDFPGGPVAETRHSQCGGPWGSIPGQGNRSRMPQVKTLSAAAKTWCSQININIKKKKKFRGCVSFARATTTKPCSLKGLNKKNVLSRSSGGWKSEIRCHWSWDLLRSLPLAGGRPSSCCGLTWSPHCVYTVCV